jgi:hypothetical protein
VEKNCIETNMWDIQMYHSTAFFANIVHCKDIHMLGDNTHLFKPNMWDVQTLGQGHSRVQAHKRWELSIAQTLVTPLFRGLTSIHMCSILVQKCAR